jgi:hypothetical protein
MALTLIGISAMSTSDIDIQISGNDKFHKMAFFAADAGVSYVAGLTETDWEDFPTPGAQLTFPDANDDTITYPLSNQLQLNGNVNFVKITNLPRGSGDSAGTFKAINYHIVSNSTGTKNATGTIDAGFDRKIIVED